MDHETRLPEGQPGLTLMGEVFLTVSIDCECDKGRGWRSQRPLAFEGVYDGVAKRLQPLFEKYGAKPTYLLSPEVMRDEKSVDVFSALAARAELGTHLHGEYADPGAFEPELTRVFQRDYPRETERDKLQSTTNAFVSAFGKKPKSFRAGRFGVGANTVGILEELGYAVDSSVTPFMRWGDPGGEIFSFEHSPTQPYRPDANAPERAGSATLVEVPVTIRPRFFGRFPIVGKYVEPRWLRPTRGTGTQLVDLAREEIREARRARADHAVVLNAMFHNVEVIPNGSPYAATEGEARAILERLETLLAFAKNESIRSIGLTDVAELIA
jgi:hypothetical protein